MPQLHTWQKGYIAIQKTINVFGSKQITINRIMSCSSVSVNERYVPRASVSVNKRYVPRAFVSLK